MTDVEIAVNGGDVDEFDQATFCGIRTDIEISVDWAVAARAWASCSWMPDCAPCRTVALVSGSRSAAAPISKRRTTLFRMT